MHIRKLVEDGETGGWIGEVLDNEGVKVGEVEVTVVHGVTMPDGSRRPNRHMYTIRDTNGSELTTGEFRRS